MGGIFGGGGGGGGSPAPAPAPSSQTVTNTSIPEYARPYVETMLGQSQALTDINQNPYQTYGGQRIAEFSPLQQQAFANVTNQTTAGQIDTGTGFATASGLGALGTAREAGGYGATVSLKGVPKEASIKRNDILLFSESNSRFIVEVSPESKKSFEKAMKGIPIKMIGIVENTKKMKVNGLNGKEVINANINTLKSNWKKPFRKLMHEEG